MTRRYALTDAKWERIKDLLPGRAGHVGRPASDNRLFVDAVLYRYRAGIPWRDLPERFGDFFGTHAGNARVFGNSTAPGLKNQGGQAIGCSQGGLSTKITPPPMRLAIPPDFILHPDKRTIWRALTYYCQTIRGKP